jgi:hypothetical protein
MDRGAHPSTGPFDELRMIWLGLGMMRLESRSIGIEMQAVNTPQILPILHFSLSIFHFQFFVLSSRPVSSPAIVAPGDTIISVMAVSVTVPVAVAVIIVSGFMPVAAASSRPGIYRRGGQHQRGVAPTLSARDCGKRREHSRREQRQ